MKQNMPDPDQWDDEFGGPPKSWQQGNWPGWVGYAYVGAAVVLLAVAILSELMDGNGD